MGILTQALVVRLIEMTEQRVMPQEDFQRILPVNRIDPLFQRGIVAHDVPQAFPTELQQAGSRGRCHHGGGPRHAAERRNLAEQATFCQDGGFNTRDNLGKVLQINGTALLVDRALEVVARPRGFPAPASGLGVVVP